MDSKQLKFLHKYKGKVMRGFRLAEKSYLAVKSQGNTIVIENKETDTFLFVRKIGNKVEIGIRGTNSITDAGYDVKRIQTKFFNGKAHRGFVQCYESVKEDVMAILLALRPSEIFIGAHSLGAAIAQLMAFDIENNLLISPEIDLVLFGSPRVFDKKLANQFRSLPINMMLIEHYADIVSNVPVIGYRKAGDPINLARWLPSWHKMSSYEKTLEKLYKR